MMPGPACDHDKLICPAIDWADKEVAKLRAALQFVADITAEELAFAKIGTGAEVALRHANRKANEALGER